MAQRLSIQIKNKIASWVSGEPIVCGNGDYEIDFLFDSEWDAHDIKTAIFNVNGDVIPKVFTGTICKVPIIWNTLMVSVGVFAGEIDDGTLSTSTPALVECLRCATDGGNLVDPPKNDVYMDIVQMVEDLNTEIETLKKGGASDEVIAETVKDYLEKNPITESDPTVPTWAKTPEKPEYTAEEVGALPSDTPIPSIEGLATEKYVDDKVAGIKIPESGTSDYTQLTNKPKINGVELDGDKALEDLGIPTGGGGVVSGSGKWELIGEVISDGTGNSTGISIPCNLNGYKQIFVCAYNLTALTNFRVCLRTALAWYNAVNFGYAQLGSAGSYNFVTGGGKMNNTWTLTGIAYDIDGVIFTYGAAEAKSNAGSAPWRQGLQSGTLPTTTTFKDIKYISLDRNSGSDTVSEGCGLKVWGCK